ncbi:MAG TPA: hypothetical protein VH477_02115 [Bryobacteraceae bacterium]
MRTESLYVLPVVPFEKTYTLGRSVSAIQILPGMNEAKPSLGLMTRLPEGAELDLRGPGFDDQTVRVRCGGVGYYVFLDDLETHRKPVASAVAAG